MLVIGMFLYNDLVFLPFARRKGWINDSLGEDAEPVIPTNSSGRWVPLNLFSSLSFAKGYYAFCCKNISNKHFCGFFYFMIS